MTLYVCRAYERSDEMPDSAFVLDVTPEICGALIARLDFIENLKAHNDTVHAMTFRAGDQDVGVVLHRPGADFFEYVEEHHEDDWHDQEWFPWGKDLLPEFTPETEVSTAPVYCYASDHGLYWTTYVHDEEREAESGQLSRNELIQLMQGKPP